MSLARQTQACQILLAGVARRARCPVPFRSNSIAPDYEEAYPFQGLHEKARRRRTRNLPGAHSDLEVESLGQQAKALVIEQSLADSPQKPFRSSNPAAEPPFHLQSNAVQDAIKAEQGMIPDDILYRNIEELISHSSTDIIHFVAEVEYERLSRELQVGFTSTQLQKYIRRGPQEVAPADLRYSLKSKNYARTAWRAGSTPMVASLAPALPRSGPSRMHREPETLTGKAKLVHHILSCIWRVESHSLSLIDGEVDVRLRPQSYDCLSINAEDSLGKLSHIYQVKIELAPSEYSLRVTGRLPSCQAAIEIIVSADFAALQT